MRRLYGQWCYARKTREGEEIMRRFLLAVALTAAVGLVVASVGSASPPPGPFESGTVTYGQSSFDATSAHFVGGGGTVEPAYDDANGTSIFIQTPNNSKVKLAKKMVTVENLGTVPVNVAPIYIVVYPTGSMDPTQLNCAHTGGDNCPDHGNLVAGAAEGADPLVYGGGVAGHDHLLGVASTGGDFNIIWEPVLVLFNPGAEITHITTLSELESADVPMTAIPELDFNCSVVPAAAYFRGTPVTPVTPDPA